VFAILTDNNMLATSPDGGDPGGGGGFTDWYLPSETELGYMYSNLYPSIGGFTGASYWTSNESITYPDTMAYVINFANGIHASVPKTNPYHVRAIRSFSGGSYSLGDVGPAGGWICYVNGTDYLEAAASDQSSSTNWETAVSLCEELGAAGIGDMFFLLNGYTWDLVNGTYDIDAEEYSGEDVIVDGMTYDSEGLPPSGAPDKVMGVTGSLVSIQNLIFMTWQPVGGDVIGYKVERSPYFSVVQSSWLGVWWQIYVGTNTQYLDNIFATGPSPITFEIKYRVCAYNATGDGPWSDEYTVAT